MAILCTLAVVTHRPVSGIVLLSGFFFITEPGL